MLYMPIFFLLLTSILCGCTDDRDSFETLFSGGNTKLTFNVNLPSGARTYALEAGMEDKVSHIYVLAFTYSSGSYQLSDWSDTSGSSIQDNSDNSKSFTVTFTRLKQERYYKFVLLANVKKEMNELLDEGLNVGAEKNATLARLQLSGITRWSVDLEDTHYRHMPMWGETPSQDGSGDKKVSSTMNISNLNLVRMLARINVTVDNSGASPATSHFKLRSVSLYNTYQKAHIVPAVGNLADGSVSKVKQPTLVDGSVVSRSSVDYDETVPGCEVSDAALTNTIYTFESVVPYENKVLKDVVLTEKMTCLVIGGEYNNEGKTTYYRLNLVNSDGTFCDILRNHSYNVNITKVNGSGQDDKEIAFDTKPVNMEAEVVVWNDGEVEEVINSGDHILSIRPGNVFNFYKEADSLVVWISTDHPDGWMISKITDYDGVTPNKGWLTIDKNLNESFGKNGAAIPLAINMAENDSTAGRTGYIYISFGHVSTRIAIHQSVVAKLKVKASMSGTPITELLFSNADIGSKTLDVIWFPRNADLQIFKHPINGFPDFIFDPILSFDVVIGGNGGTGKKSYAISPQPFTSDELAANPFLERMSRLEFMTSNGENYALAPVLVRQVHFNLLTENIVSSYLLNGSSYTFSVKSNACWRIKSVTESVSNLLGLASSDNLKTGFEGGVDTDPGTTIRFTVVNSDNLNGTVTVVFESVDTPQRFNDVTAVLHLSSH